MRSGVRTVQRYEREFGLPVRRPTGKLRGSVMATRAEIDAWVAAGPIRQTFRLVRAEQNSHTQSQTDKIENGIIAMRKLKEQMQALRIETRSALNLLIDRVSGLRLLMPSARPSGYQPLVNMLDRDLDMDDMDMDMRRRLSASLNGGAELSLAPSSQRRNSGERQHDKTSLLTAQTQKPH